MVKTFYKETSFGVASYRINSDANKYLQSNLVLCKTTLRVTFYKDNVQKFHHGLILGMVKMQALTPIPNRISNSCQ